MSTAAVIHILRRQGPWRRNRVSSNPKPPLSPPDPGRLPAGLPPTGSPPSLRYASRNQAPPPPRHRPPPAHLPRRPPSRPRSQPGPHRGYPRVLLRKRPHPASRIRTPPPPFGPLQNHRPAETGLIRQPSPPPTLAQHPAPRPPHQPHPHHQAPGRLLRPPLPQRRCGRCAPGGSRLPARLLAVFPRRQTAVSAVPPVSLRAIDRTEVQR